MTEKRYSLVVIGVSVALALGIGFFALVSGLFLGYQWGKSAGKAEIIEELPGIGARAIGPLLEEFMPRGRLGTVDPSREPGWSSFSRRAVPRRSIPRDHTGASR